MKANQLTNLKTAIIDFIRSHKLVLVLIKGFSRFNHQLCLFFFQNKIWKNFTKNISNLFGGHNPSYLLFPIRLLSFSKADASSEVGNQPLYKPQVSIGNGNACGKVNSSSVNLIGFSDAPGFPFHNSFIGHRDGSFTVYDSRKIRQLLNGIFHKLKEYHNNDIKTHRERLNPATPLGDAIV